MAVSTDVHLTTLFASKNAQALHRKRFTIDSPDQYRDIIAAHAHLNVRKSLYAGPNYRDFETFLRHDTQATARASGGQGIGRKIATLHDLNLKLSQSDAIQHYSEVSSLASILEHKKRQNEPNQALILFLKGHLSPEWILYIGYFCEVDPEFWLRHLGSRDHSAGADYFASPSLPSSASNIIQLNVPSIGFRQRQEDQSQAQLERLRAEAHDAFRKYQRETSIKNTAAQPGDSIVRDFDVHDAEHFSLEQNMTICVNRFGKGCITIVWSDFGTGLSQGVHGPWSPQMPSGRMCATSILPTILHKPDIALKTSFIKKNESHDVPEDRWLQQSATSLPANYGRLHDQNIAAQDPFYAINELFFFAASAELQLLNMISSKISMQMTESQVFASEMPAAHYQRSSHVRSESERLSLLTKAMNVDAHEARYASTSANLLHYKNILDNRVRLLKDSILLLDSGPNPKWPRATDDKLRDKIRSATDSLLADYQHLRDKAETLRATCERGIDIAGTNAMIAESRIAIEQARQVKRLTVLATFFIPASFTTSLFGMNFVELGQGSLNMWWWPVVLLPLYLVLVIFLYGLPTWLLPIQHYDKLAMMSRFRWRRKMQPDGDHASI